MNDNPPSELAQLFKEHLDKHDEFAAVGIWMHFRGIYDSLVMACIHGRERHDAILSYMENILDETFTYLPTFAKIQLNWNNRGNEDFEASQHERDDLQVIAESVKSTLLPLLRPTGYVYFATNEKLIKIGHTNNLNKRMDVIGIEPIHHLQVVDYRKAERYFHEVFKEYRVKGEWFQLDENQIGWITRLWTPSDNIICDLNGFEIWRAE